MCCCEYILFLIVDDTRRNDFIYIILCLFARIPFHSRPRRIACNVFKVSATPPPLTLMAHDHNLNYKTIFALFLFLFQKFRMCASAAKNQNIFYAIVETKIFVQIVCECVSCVLLFIFVIKRYTSKMVYTSPLPNCHTDAELALEFGTNFESRRKESKCTLNIIEINM